MSGMTINGSSYVLQRMEATISNCMPSIYLQFDVYNEGQLVRAHGISLQSNQAKAMLVGNVVRNAYAALVSDLNCDAEIPGAVSSELSDSSNSSLIERIESMREMYRQSTQAICQIAGEPVVNRLEDVDFVNVRAKAMAVDFVSTSILCDNLMYCLSQLYRLDGDDAWDRI